MFSAFRVMLKIEIFFKPKGGKYQQVEENCIVLLMSFTIRIVHENIIRVAKSRTIMTGNVARMGENIHVYTSGSANVEGSKRPLGKLRCR
jgi:uncharacterized membrane protein YoaK (UPF0700 family)